jgi:hypothetical protein
MQSCSAVALRAAPARALPRAPRLRRPAAARAPRAGARAACCGAAGACCAVFQTAAGTTAAVLAASVVGYTAWEAPTAFNAGALTDMLTLRKGVLHAAQLLNKAVSVAGLALVALAFLPAFAPLSRELTLHALVLLAAHATFSTIRYYGTPIVPAIQTWAAAGLPRPGASGAAAVKVAALFLGGVAQQCLGAGVLQFVSRSVLAYGALSLGAAHFLAERADKDGVPRVPPAGVAALALVAVALVSVATGTTVV